MVVDVAEDGSLVSVDKIFEGEFGRIRTAQIGSDGVLYLLTANGDNDKIVRISEAPVQEITKFTSNESGGDQTVLYVVIGVMVVGAIIGMIILKRKRWLFTFLIDVYGSFDKRTTDIIRHDNHYSTTFWDIWTCIWVTN